MPRRIVAEFICGPWHGLLREIDSTPVYVVPVFRPLLTLASEEIPVSSDLNYFEARYSYRGLNSTRETHFYSCSNVAELQRAGWRPECGTNICGSRPCPHGYTRELPDIQLPSARELREAWESTQSPDSYRINAARLGADKEIEEWDKFVAEIKAKKGTK